MTLAQFDILVRARRKAEKPARGTEQYRSVSMSEWAAKVTQ